MNTVADDDERQEWFAFVTPDERAHARRTDPDTSHLAADQLTSERLNRIQQEVLNYFKRVTCASDEQMLDFFRGNYGSESTVRTRRAELVQQGLLEDSGKRVYNRNARLMILWRIVEKPE